MKLGFVILTYNRPHALLAVLRALAPQCPQDAVVVVADDGSRPEAVETVQRGLPAFGCKVRHVWHPDVGFTAARARNLGAAHSEADYLVFIDGDCVPTQHFVRAHLALAQAGHFVNGSRVLLDQAFTAEVESGRTDPVRLRRAQWLPLRAAGRVNKLTHLLYLPHLPGRLQHEFSWKGIRSCNFGVGYRDFDAVNGFDESFTGWGHEDADLVLRLHHARVVRKNGFLATEVFHLWHREQSRAGEGANRERVLARSAGGIVRAERGLAELGTGTNPRVADWN